MHQNNHFIDSRNIRTANPRNVNVILAIRYGYNALLFHMIYRVWKSCDFEDSIWENFFVHTLNM